MSDKLEAIRVARTWLCSRQTYLSCALYSMVLVESRQVPFMGVDRWWRCYWNPDTLRHFTVEVVGSILYHEVWHLLREHAMRAELLGISCDGKVADPFRCSLWNKGTDGEINDDAEHEADISLPEWVIYPRSFGCEEGETAEVYYAHLLKITPPPSPSSASSGPGGQALNGGTGSATAQPMPSRPASAPSKEAAQGAGELSGSASDGVSRPWERPPDDETYPGVSPGEGKLIAHEVARKILERSTSRGSQPSGVLRWAQEILSPPKVRWGDEVLSVLRGQCAHVSGCWDYSYMRPSRRQGLMRDIIMPSMIKPKPQVAAVIDTSGSMSDEQTGVAVLELSSLIRKLGVPVHVLSVDAAVHHAVQSFGRVDRKLYGGGGTDMDLGIREAVKMHPRPNLIVVFTDGLTGWPSRNPGVPVVIVLISDEAIATPDWARTIRVDPGEFSYQREA